MEYADLCIKLSNAVDNRILQQQAKGNKSHAVDYALGVVMGELRRLMWDKCTDKERSEILRSINGG